MSGGWGGDKGGDSDSGGASFWGNGNGHGGPSNCEPKKAAEDLSHKVLAPEGGASYHTGEQVTVSWQSGLRSEALHIDGPPWAGGFHPASWQWSAFLRPEGRGKDADDDGQAEEITILDNQNFTFGYDVSWKVLDDCTNTAVNQTWTIPTTLDLGSEGGDKAVFKVVVVNVTNPDSAAQSSITGPAFTILRGTATSSPDDTSAAGEGGISATSSSPTDSGSTTTTTTAALLSPASSPASPDEVSSSQEQQSQQGQGLSTGAKAGIGVGVGVSALFFLLTLSLLFWRRWRRRRRPGQGKGSPDVELPGDSKMGMEKDQDKGPVLEVEAPVPGELSAVNHDEFGYEGRKEKEKFAGLDPSAPRYPSAPVEMPADEAARAELPESPHR